MPQRNQRGHHHGNRYLSVLAHARTHRRDDQRSDGLGRRMVYAYTGGIDRSSDGIPYEFPGAMNDTAKGIGRLAKTYFSSRDQLVTLGFGGGPGPAVPGADYTGWQLARAFGASIYNHNVGGPKVVIDAATDARNGTNWSDVTFIHCTRWQDEPLAQISYDLYGYPKENRSKAWEIWRDRGAHVSIAVLIEMQMQHGMPPFQQALDHGILPSRASGIDAVDGSSTGTRVPWTEGAVRRPRFAGANPCRRLRRSVSISQSRFFRFMASPRTVMWLSAVN